jgi:hypothetical protein
MKNEQEWLNSLTEQELTELLVHLEALNKHIDDEKIRWKPLPGPQTAAYNCQADILFYGGAAGGGKTDLILGVAHQNHSNVVIFRREYGELKGIIRRGDEMFGKRSQQTDYGKYNKVDKIWNFPDGRTIELGGVQHEGDEEKWQGLPHDLKAFDEIDKFSEEQFRFLIGWNRTSNPNQRCRVIATGNPPTSAEGDWVIEYWGPWLDETHPNPAKPGELRWYTTNKEGKDVECKSGEPFINEDGETVQPLSRTFIPARVEDNPFLMASGYKARLQALPEPLRSKMLKGDFTAGKQDDPWQVIPTQWVKEAQERWKNIPKPNVPMTCLGVDVARGGQDQTVLSPRYLNWFDKQLCFPGTDTPDGQYVASLVLANRPSESTMVNVDVIGVGASVYDLLNKVYKIPVMPLHSSEHSEETDKSKQLSFINKRAEWWWKLREALDPQGDQKLAIPDDRQLRADLTAPRWEMTARGIKVEAKEDIKDRIGRSPDKGDALVYSFAQIKAAASARLAHIPNIGR